MSKYLELKRRALMLGVGTWFVPFGLSWDNCIAAYRFKGAASQAESAKDITLHGYDLTYSSASWSAANGLTAGTITQSSLSSLTNIVTQVVWYSNYSSTWDSGNNGITPITNMKFRTNGTPMMCLYMAFSTKTHDSESWTDFINSGHWGAVLTNYRDSGSSGDYTRTTYITTSSNASASGVIAVDKTNNTLWKNGTQQTTSSNSLTSWEQGSGSYFSEASRPVLPESTRGTAYIKAAAYFNCALNAEQHTMIANAMQEL